jgi:hypothetical protein
MRVARHFKAHRCNPDDLTKSICEAILKSGVPKDDCYGLFLRDLSAKIGEEPVNTVVLARTVSEDKVVELRSYSVNARTKSPVDCKVWEAGRATSVCRMYVPPFKLGDADVHFCDVGTSDVGTSVYNPSLRALREARELWKSRTAGKHVPIACFLSIGTGTSPRPTMPKGMDVPGRKSGRISKAVQYHLDIIKSCEDTHEKFLYELKQPLAPQIPYWRLNVPDIGKLGLDEHKYRGRILDETTQYLAMAEKEIDQIVRILKTTKPAG